MDHVGPHLMRAAEARFGVPREKTVQQELLSWELDLIERVCGAVRYHDVTVFTFWEDPAGRGASDPHMALIHKPQDPPGALWAPTGGVERGESLEEAVVREAYEELGLRVRPVRYVLRMEATFHCGRRIRPWRSHVFVAAPALLWDEAAGGQGAAAPLAENSGGLLPPLLPVDRHEVAYASWVRVSDFVDRVVPVLRRAGWGRFGYRLAITEHLLTELGLVGRSP